MALIKCPKCYKEISDTLGKCNFCGFDFDYYKKHPKMMARDVYLTQVGAKTDDSFVYLIKDDFDYNNKKSLKIKYKNKSFDFSYKERNTIHLLTIFNDSLNKLIEDVNNKRKSFKDYSDAKEFQEYMLKSIQLYFGDIFKYSIDILDIDVDAITKLMPLLTDYFKSFSEKYQSALRKSIKEFQTAGDKFNTEMEINRMKYIGSAINSRTYSYELSPALGLFAISRAGSKFDSRDAKTTDALKSSLNETLENTGDSIRYALVDVSKNAMLAVISLFVDSKKDWFKRVPFYDENEINELLDNPYDYLIEKYKTIEISKEDLLKVLDYFNYKDRLFEYYEKRLSNETIENNYLIEVYAYLKGISEQEVFDKFVKEKYIKSIEDLIKHIYIKPNTYKSYQNGLLDEDINNKYLSKDDSNRLKHMLDEKIESCKKEENKKSLIKKIIIFGIIAILAIIIILNIVSSVSNIQSLKIIGKYWCKRYDDQCIRFYEDSYDLYTKDENGYYKKENVKCHLSEHYSDDGKSYSIFIAYDKNPYDGQWDSYYYASTTTRFDYKKDELEIEGFTSAEHNHDEIKGYYDLVNEEPSPLQ